MASISCHFHLCLHFLITVQICTELEPNRMHVHSHANSAWSVGTLSRWTLIKWCIFNNSNCFHYSHHNKLNFWRVLTLFSLCNLSRQQQIENFCTVFNLYRNSNVLLQFRVSLLLIQLEIDFLLREIVFFQFPLVLAFKLFWTDRPFPNLVFLSYRKYTWTGSNHARSRQFCRHKQ